MIRVAQFIRFNPVTAIKKQQLLRFYLIYNNNYECYSGILSQNENRKRIQREGRVVILVFSESVGESSRSFALPSEFISLSLSIEFHCITGSAHPSKENLK